jgi:short-subunit dehydrogenase
MATPSYAVYGASKAALNGFARNLRVELEGRIRVQTIHPGATRTPMHEYSGVPVTQQDGRHFADAATVADQIIRSADAGDRTTSFGLGNQLLLLAGRHAGRLVDWAVHRS